MLDTPTGTTYFAHGYFPRLGSISQEATAIRQDNVWSINSTGSVGGPLIMHTDPSGPSIYSFVQGQLQWRLARLEQRDMDPDRHQPRSRALFRPHQCRAES
jgi:hypothetical protein